MNNCKIEITKNDLVFKSNGFFYKNIFYPYQIIAHIDKVTSYTDDDYLRCKLGVTNEVNSYAYISYSFKIYLNDPKIKHIDIGYCWYKRLYVEHRYTLKDGFFKWLFNTGFIKNIELNTCNFNIDIAELEQYKKDLEALRLEFIENFNQWKK